MSITVPTLDNPTPPAHKAWVGAAWGNLAAIIPAAIAMTINPFLGLATSFAGIMGGYFVGRDTGELQKKTEIREGKKEVKEPSYWNHGLAKGWVISTLISMGTAALSLTVFNASMGGFLRLAGSIVGIGIMIAGSINTKKEMRLEYEEGLTARKLEPISHVAGKSPAQQLEIKVPAYEVTPPESTKFARTEEERRANASQQTRMS